MGLGDCNIMTDINFFFTSPFELDGLEKNNGGVLTGKELNKIFKSSPNSIDLLLN